MQLWFVFPLNFSKIHSPKTFWSSLFLKTQKMAVNMTRIMISKFKSSYCLVDGSFPLNLITRRGYSATTQAEEGSTKREHQQKTEEKRANSVSIESSWVPDPVTGYYKPSSTQTSEGIINNNNKNTNKP